jgi:hypothetical protein
MKPSSRFLCRSALSGGLVAGTIDIGAASLINWVNPLVICQAIASGLLGRASFHEGAASMALGLLLQWLMSILIAACCVFAGQYLPILRKRWVEGGLAFGFITFVVMNYVVVPLSAVGHVPHFSIRTFVENMLAMLLFGVIISFFARETPPRRSPA